MKRNETAVIRKFILKRMDDQELRDMCSDYFYDVYNDFTIGMRKRQMVELLLDYCYRHNRMSDLRELVYSTFADEYNFRDYYVDVSWTCSLLPKKYSGRRIVAFKELELLTIGYANDNDIVLRKKLVSSKHAQLFRDKDDLVLKDLNSKNGILSNGNKRLNKPWSIDGICEVFEIRPFTLTITKIFAPLRFTLHWQHRKKDEKDKVEGVKLPFTIGRDPLNNALILPDEKVSRCHATIDVKDCQLILTDNLSDNGCFLNGIKIDNAVLGPVDDLVIGPYKINIEPFVPESRKKTKIDSQK